MADAQSEQELAATRASAAAVLLTAGQRRINIIWEVTQALVALAVTATTLIVAGTMASRTDGNGAFLLLSNVFFLVVGTYFQRTNHTKSSGSISEHR